MSLFVHLALLAAVVVATLVLVAWDRGRSQRPIGKLLLAVSPFVVIGGLCGLLMSATGVPVVEWALPALAVLVVGLICRSDRFFNGMRWAMLVVAAILCVNFTGLVHGSFTAEPSYSERESKSRQRVVLTAAGKALRESYPPQTVLPEGPVSEILDDPQFNVVDVFVFEPQWHTPLTRLYRIKRNRASLWYPGGDVATASQRLKLRSGVGA